ncbi:MAG: hypothetical protein ACI9EF_003109 [Pseudohongiellaceae bacterium]|jgi:hypothetical protein
MFLLQTCVTGGLIWWISGLMLRAPHLLGGGAPAVYGGVFAFVALLAVASAGPRPVVHSFSVSLARVVFGGCLLVISVSMALAVLTPAHSPLPALVAGLFFGVLGIPLSLVVRWLGRRCGGVGTVVRVPGPDAPGHCHVLLSLTPLLVPLAALLVVGSGALALGPGVRNGPTAQAGVLSWVLFPCFYPAALVVAFGLDRLDGSLAGRGASNIRASALAVMVMGIGALSPALWTLHDAPLSSSTPWDLLTGVASGFARFRPFLRPVLSATGEWTFVPQQLDGLISGAAAMMFACSWLPCDWLTRVGQGGRGPSGWAVAALIVVPVVAGLALLPLAGAAGAPWAGVLACAVAWFVQRWVTVRAVSEVG